MPNDEIKLKIDAIFALRQRRDMIAGTLDDQIKRLTSQLEAFMRGAQVEKERSENATAYFRQVEGVEVQDWSKVFAYVEENQAHDMLQRRITPKAALERIKAEGAIPGMTVKTSTEFVVRALPKKGEEKSDEN